MISFNNNKKKHIKYYMLFHSWNVKEAEWKKYSITCIALKTADRSGIIIIFHSTTSTTTLAAATKINDALKCNYNKNKKVK